MLGAYFYAESITHGPYDPATDPNFVAIWEADSGIASTAGVVSSWTDRVASIVATGAVGHRPSIVANQINTSLPVVRFSSAVAYQLLIPPASNILVANGYFISVVLRPTAASLVSGANTILGLTFPTTVNTSGIIVVASVAGGLYGPGPSWGGNPETGSGMGGWPVSNGSYGVSSFTYNTSTFDIWNFGYVGGGLDVPANFSFTQNFSPITVQLAPNAFSDPNFNVIGEAQGTNTNTYNGDVAAVYLAKLPPTGGRLTQFQTYISNKWGI
jgi:hypothetical protein